METEFIYWRHPTPAGIKVEEICGGEDRNGEIWRQMALQVYCENGKDGYREIGHYPNGAPFLIGSPERISITHTQHFLAVATLPKTPEVDLAHFNVRTAMGIDAEREDREQVIRVREKFLSDTELAMISKDDIRTNILAWTIKEALYKAALTPGIDFRNALSIETLPEISEIVDFRKSTTGFGHASISFPDGTIEKMSLFSWLSEGCIVTIAFSPKCAKAVS